MIYIYSEFCCLEFVSRCQAITSELPDNRLTTAGSRVPLKPLNFKPEPNLESTPNFGDTNIYNELCCPEFVS
jgi:hypothetical protein